MSDNSPSRRNVLKLGVGLVGAAALGGAGMAVSGTTTQTPSSAPALEWKRVYDREVEQEYEFDHARSFTVPGDGGFAIFGDGARITKTGKKNPEFAMLKADSEGNKQWVGFADPTDDSYNYYDFYTWDGVVTSDGGYGMVGRTSVNDRYGEEIRVAVAGKIGPDGEEIWAKRLDNIEQSEDGDGVVGGYVELEATAPTADGGLVALGRYDQQGWFVKFAADGTVVVDRKYDGGSWMVSDVYALDTGYEVFLSPDGGRTLQVFEFSETGEKVSSTLLDVPNERGDTLSTPDGGYVYAGSKNQDMYLAKLASDGSKQWEQTYDGPYEGSDGAGSVVQAPDGGYAIAGVMQEAYSGDRMPTILRTDAEGNEQWRKIIKDQGGGSLDDLVQADDGGFVGLMWAEVFKLEATEGDPSGTPTDIPSETPTESPGDGDDSGTPEDTPQDGTDTPTEGDDGSGDGGPGSGDDGDGSDGSNSGSGDGSDSPNDGSGDSGVSGDDCEI
jgi:hypothetical protein